MGRGDDGRRDRGGRDDVAGRAARPDSGPAGRADAIDGGAGAGRTPPTGGRIPDVAERDHAAAERRSHPSRDAQIVARALDDLGAGGYRREHPLAPDAHATFAWPAARRALDVDGGVHLLPAFPPDGTRAAYDAARLARVEAHGWEVLVLIGDDLRPDALPDTLAVLRAFLADGDDGRRPSSIAPPLALDLPTTAPSAAGANSSGRDETAAGANSSGRDETAAAPTTHDRAPVELEEDIRAALGGRPDIADVVTKLVRDPHPLNLTRDLSNPETRQRTLAILRDMAAGVTLHGQDLTQFVKANPGRGPLFEPIPERERKSAGRTAAFVAAAREIDPARGVGAHPDDREKQDVKTYARRLYSEVEPHVRDEVMGITDTITSRGNGAGAEFNVRTKDSSAILDKVTRMVEGSAGRAGRPDYRVGDVIDAVGARITVDNTEQLAFALDEVRRYFGDRILETENLYLDPKSHEPSYRVIPMVIAVDVDTRPYTFELQLTTRRASVAADLNHNTLYKSYIALSDSERAAVRAAMAEAAALEQRESNGSKE